MTRISQRSHLLQPALLATSPTEWRALMRDTRPHGKIGVSKTHDGGKSWFDAPDLPLDNPDAGIATLSVGDQHLLAFNPSVSHRKSLRLARSADGERWVTELELEHGLPGQEFSYPAMAWADQSLWLSYTDQRKSIAWRRLEWVHAVEPVAIGPAPVSHEVLAKRASP
jgi:predicted neuraminidase